MGLCQIEAQKRPGIRVGLLASVYPFLCPPHPPQPLLPPLLPFVQRELNSLVLLLGVGGGGESANIAHSRGKNLSSSPGGGERHPLGPENGT